jgi:hypothetical protein
MAVTALRDIRATAKHERHRKAAFQRQVATLESSPHSIEDLRQTQYNSLHAQFQKRYDQELTQLRKPFELEISEELARLCKAH